MAMDPPEQTVLHDGIDKQALARGYGKAIKWLAADNRFGRIVFGVSRVAFSRPIVGRITYQAFATECKVRDEGRRPLSVVLWKIASGTADDREILREMFGYRVLRSLLVGLAVTLRNLVFEAIFGLKWGEYGRYPTVVLKEKREAFKKRLALSLMTELESSDFEPMYVIKIRGSEDAIMEQLANFGLPGARFLNLRFVEVRQVLGVPNQVGSVIRYRIPLVGLGAELRLTNRVGFETLLYQLDERLADHGKLIFNVAPTKDGNSRLSIYAAFNYKKGDGVAGRVLCEAVKLLTGEHLRVLQAITSKVALSIENALKFRQAESSATTDYLTGLPNARSLFMHLDQEVARCKREGSTVAVMVCDMDGFKQINDGYGHLEGDKTLKVFANLLREVFREYDYVARMGGDEFVIVAPNMTPDAVNEKATLLGALAQQAGRPICGKNILSVSVGTAFYGQDGTDAEGLLADADRKMYAAKRLHHEQSQSALQPRAAKDSLPVSVN